MGRERAGSRGGPPSGASPPVEFGAGGTAEAGRLSRRNRKRKSLMRASRLYSHSVGALLLLGGSVAAAPGFPANINWIPLTINNGTILTDPSADAQGGGAREIVGDASNPAVYVAADATHLYFRMRLDVTVLQSASNLKPFGWGCELDTNSDLNNY